MVVSEPEFASRIREVLAEHDLTDVSYVTGPGRSGAIAAVYASHLLGIPFVPFGQKAPGDVLIIDTARQSGKTMRKAMRRYETLHGIAVYEEPPRVHFWYET
jgi:adenine/guanine phosphoribosyltransferase-like PRPP-binding protein